MDCNKTINFLHEFKRLCASRDGCVADAANKERCPMFGVFLLLAFARDACVEADAPYPCAHAALSLKSGQAVP